MKYTFYHQAKYQQKEKKKIAHSKSMFVQLQLLVTIISQSEKFGASAAEGSRNMISRLKSRSSNLELPILLHREAVRRDLT